MSSAKTIFLASLQQPAGTRRAFAEQACGDDHALRDRVLALLMAHEEMPDPRPAPLEGPGDTIGPYRLLEQIGEGGFGVVHVAEQSAPVRRRVALKLIKPGMDTREVLARFDAERQALALMDHPGIAKIFDGGQTPSGRPYFAMELVPGLPITDYCDRSHLPVADRLRLFADVCRAVQHAHQKGVIHRDLKPSNVLVAMRDGAARPCIIDFGVAKATATPLTAATFHTRFAQWIGTPLYMSPEQAEMSPLEVDTRSDVYSLGVLLYELLTGATPITRERLADAAFDEVRRIIREEEPLTPSSRLATASAATAEIAARRRTVAHRLAHSVRGDLDWIAMKALEKDRARRYESAGELAAEVERFLRDEPVLARPPSAWYRARKFARRHRRSVVAAVIVALAVAGAGWAVLDRAARGARIGRDVESARREASGLREDAWSHAADPGWWETKLAAATAALRPAESWIASSAGELDPALTEQVRLLAAELEADERDRRTVAALESIPLDRAVSDQRLAPARAWIDRYRDAFLPHGIAVTGLATEAAAAVIASKREPVRDAMIAGLDEWRALADEPAEAEWLRAVLDTAEQDAWRRRVRAAADAADRAALEDLAGLAEAKAQSPATLRLLVTSLLAHGGRDAAIALLRAAQLDRPASFWIAWQLATALLDAGRSAEAVIYGSVGAALRPDSSVVHVGLGLMLDGSGALSDSIAAFRRATVLDPMNAVAWNNFGNALRLHGELDDAVAALREAIRLRPDYAIAHNNLGVALHASGNDDAAIEEYRRAVACDAEFAGPHNNLGACFADRGEIDAAIAEYRRAVAIDGRYANALRGLGTQLNLRGDHAEAVEVLRRLVEVVPGDPRERAQLGAALLSSGEFAAAAAEYRRVLDADPSYAGAHHDLGLALRELGQLDAAAAELRAAIELEPTANSYGQLGTTLMRAGDRAGAAAAFRAAFELERTGDRAYSLGVALSESGDSRAAADAYREAIALSPDSSMAHYNLGCSLQRLGELPDAAASYRRAIELKEDDACAHTNLAWVVWQLGDFPTALAEFRAAIGHDPELPEARVGLGSALEWQGEYESAAAAYREAVALQPARSEHRFGLGRALYLAGRLEESVEELREAVDLDPGSVAAYGLLSGVCADLGETTDAERAARRAAELAPDSAQAQWSWGGAARVAGDLDTAEGAVRRALEIDPNHAFAKIELAYIEHERGHRDRALELWSEVLRLPRTDGDGALCSYLAVVLSAAPDPRIRDAERGLALARRALAELPKFWGSWRVLGMALVRAGEHEEAVAALERSMAGGRPGAVVDYLFLAMGQERLGRREAALESYGRAVAWLEARAPEDAEIAALHAEAKAALGLESDR